MTTCEACGGKGWLLSDNSDYGLRIERCDACEQFDSDAAAVTHVAERAGLDELTAGELCDVIDRAAGELIERNEEARLEGAHELWPATTGAIVKSRK